jgi:hypothetical protein
LGIVAPARPRREEAAMTFQPQMRPEHAQAFREAARIFDVYILVRRTNLASLAHVGAADCVPKRLDCKAKTADQDYVHPQHGPKKVAGLVVDPTLTGPAAFATGKKHASALKEWAKFSATMLHPAMATPEGQKAKTYIPGGGLYFVDLDPKSPRFGCVKFTSSSLISAGKYIHGDFDLYGVVPAGNPSRNVAVQEMRLGQHHARSPEFFDVQHYVNRRIGVPMVLHGAQEAYAEEHSDEGVDVFAPDGRVFGVENQAQLMGLYEGTFRGRKLFTRDGPREVVRGLFMAPG